MTSVGTYNQNNKFIPSKDYVGELKKLCHPNDVITYSMKKSPKSTYCFCTVSITRLNSSGKPKQETSELVRSEREAQCLAANQMILRMQKNVQVPHVKKVAQKNDKEEEQADENLVFDYSDDFKPKKTAKKLQVVDLPEPLEQPADFQPFHQFSAVSLPIREDPTDYSFHFQFNGDGCCGKCNVKTARDIKSIFGECKGKFTFTNISKTKTSVIGNVYSILGRTIAVQLCEPLEGYVTFEFSNVAGKLMEIREKDTVAMTFEKLKDIE